MHKKVDEVTKGEETRPCIDLAVGLACKGQLSNRTKCSVPVGCGHLPGGRGSDFRDGDGMG